MVKRHPIRSGPAAGEPIVLTFAVVRLLTFRELVAIDRPASGTVVATTAATAASGAPSSLPPQSCEARAVWPARPIGEDRGVSVSAWWCRNIGRATVMNLTSDLPPH